jgi:hypothetical protein
MHSTFKFQNHIGKYHLKHPGVVEDNINLDFRKVDREDVNWIGLSQDTLLQGPFAKFVDSPCYSES